MPNASRVYQESTVCPTLLLPVLIVMRAIIVVMGLRAVTHVLHTLIRLQEAHPAGVMKVMRDSTAQLARLVSLMRVSLWDLMKIGKM